MSRKFLTGIDLVNNKISNVADGTAATDGVTLQQLQAAIRGLSWKDEVRAASTANITLTAPGASIDGVAMAANDRFLGKNQTAGSENGIYVWNGAAVAATRAPDADSASELISAVVMVTEGTVNADRAYVLNTDNITLGTTSLNFVQFGGGGAVYTAGNGLALNSNAFSVFLDTNSGLLVTGTGLKIDPSVVVRKYAAMIGNGSLTSIPVVHNLGTTDITLSVKDVATNALVDADPVVTDANTVTVTFGTAPASNAYRVVVHG